MIHDDDSETPLALPESCEMARDRVAVMRDEDTPQFCGHLQDFAVTKPNDSAIMRTQEIDRPLTPAKATDYPVIEIRIRRNRGLMCWASGSSVARRSVSQG
ncbi:MAG TPA: hypothetical protein VKG25_03885, partial [Bryobacteraceae bacterium]|nr:hypothetical protein [Bryobacteraceae bacterium]